MIGRDGRPRPRIAIIGPVLPFRGGIAQHTTMLARTLRKQAEARTYSFSRQYPARIFPGDSDRDPDHAAESEPGTAYLIDTVNPLTWGPVAADIVRWRPDLVVLPWWHVYFAPLFLYLTTCLRRSGIPIVYLCHNVVEHETASWRRALTKRVLGRADGFVVHTESEREQLEHMLGVAQVEVHPIPVFESFPRVAGTEPREHALELLFFGFVRPYKGLDVLAEAMRLVDPSLDVRLTVVGEFWSGAADLRSRLEQDATGRVEVVPRYVSEREAAQFFGRSDVVVLPYRSATGSAVVALAYHFGVPVIASRIGGLPDVVVPGRTGFLVDPESPSELAAAIEDAATCDLDAMSREVDALVAERMSWTGLARSVLVAAGLGPLVLDDQPQSPRAGERGSPPGPGSGR